MARRYIPKVHADLGAGLSLCGTVGYTAPSPPPKIAKAVTCRLCRRRWVAAVREIEAAAEAARLAAIPPATHSTRWVSSGIHVTAADRRIIARSIDGEDRSETPRWGTWRSALGALFANRDAGVPLASTSSPDRFERGKMGGGSAASRPAPGTDHDLVDIAHAWDRAIERATVDAQRAGLRAEGAPIAERIVRQLAELRFAGRPEVTRSPGRVPQVMRIVPMPKDVGQPWELTPKEVAVVVRAVLARLDEQEIASVHVARRVDLRRDRPGWDPRVRRGSRRRSEGESAA